MEDVGSSSNPVVETDEQELYALAPQSPELPIKHPVAPQASGGTCATCGTSNESSGGQVTRNYVYAIGQVQPRFPTLGVEKEFSQVTGRAETLDLTDSQVLHAVLSDPQNQYLARQLCWVMTIEGLDTYILHPRDPRDFDRLVDAIRPNPGPVDVDVVIGTRGPLAPSELCGGLMLPIVMVDKIYSFHLDALLEELPKPEKMAAQQKKQFKATAESLFKRIAQVADNAGATDEHRALNYMAVRYDAIYANCVEAHGNNCSISNISVRTSRLSIARKVLDVVFTHTHRQTGVQEKHFVRVDVTDQFPFLVTPMSPDYIYDQYP